MYNRSRSPYTSAYAAATRVQPQQVSASEQQQAGRLSNEIKLLSVVDPLQSALSRTSFA